MYAKFQFLITFTDRKKTPSSFLLKKCLLCFVFLCYNYLELFAKMICVWFRIWIVNSLQLWHICSHKYRFCDVWGVAGYILKKVPWLRSSVIYSSSKHPSLIVCFIPPRPIMAKSACLYLHVSLSHYLVKCGVFFLRRRRCILSWGIFSGFVIWWIKQIELCQWAWRVFFFLHITEQVF